MGQSGTWSSPNLDVHWRKYKILQANKFLSINFNLKRLYYIVYILYSIHRLYKTIYLVYSIFLVFGVNSTHRLLVQPIWLKKMNKKYFGSSKLDDNENSPKFQYFHWSWRSLSLYVYFFAFPWFRFSFITIFLYAIICFKSVKKCDFCPGQDSTFPRINSSNQ